MKPSLPVVLVSLSVWMEALSGIAIAQEQTNTQPTPSHIELNDVHDHLVYARYPREVVQGKIDYKGAKKHIELPRPATLNDVAAGHALFSFEGLGERRSWKLPVGPCHGDWQDLKQFPLNPDSKKIRYKTSGFVVQAEELKVGGIWKRYFGYVNIHGVAIVPAEKIYLSEIALRGETRQEGLLPGGLTWCTSKPYAPETSTPENPSRCIDLFLLNCRGVPITANMDWYRAASSNDGPALAEGITLKLKYAPFKPRTPEKSYPWRDDYTALELTRETSFTPTNRLVQMETGGFRKVGTLDFADWFDIRKEGHYSLDFKFDAVAMGLSEEPVSVPSPIGQGFKVGPPPPRLIAEELNETIPPFGGRFTEQQLRDLIVQSVKPPLVLQKNMQSTQPIILKFREIKKHSGENNIFRMGWDDNSFGTPLPIRRLFDSNRKLINTLKEYDSHALLEELEHQIKNTEDRDTKLMLASLAASRGSADAALCLLDGMMTTDYDLVRAVHYALYQTLFALEAAQPDWIIELVIAALADRRYVTNTNHGSGTHLTISYYADERADLTNLLGHLKCTEAVPFLIQMCEDTSGARGPVMALGDIGDDRAIPILIKYLTNAAKTVKHDKGTGLPDEFSRPIYALANLRAQEATLIFLEYLAFPDVIESLAFLDDQRAVAPLENLIANEGLIIQEGEEVYPYLAADRLVEAKITLACLADDPTPQLCALIGDESFSEFQQRRVVWELGRDVDPRAIPALINAVQTDPSGTVVNQSIAVLAEFKYKIAVDGLIECFDADFEEKQDWKRAYNPEMFRKNIGESLTEITGHDLGPNKKEWLKWWSAHRDSFEEATPLLHTKN